MTSVPAALLLLAASALGHWLEYRQQPRPRLYWGGPPSLADVLEHQPRRVRPLEGVRRG